MAIPFAEPLPALVPARQVRMRRDFTQLLTLIQAHALLHQRQRERDAGGRIVADARDYAAVYAIAAPIFGALAAEGVTPAVRETVAAVRAARGVSDAPVTLTQLLAHLDLDKASISRRVNQAIKAGWLGNDEERKGRPAKIVIGEPLPEERPALPAPGELFVSPPVQRRNTPASDADSPHHAWGNTVASADATVVQRSQHPAPTVAPVAEPLHGGGEQHFSPRPPAVPRDADDAAWRAYRRDYATYRAALGGDDA